MPINNSPDKQQQALSALLKKTVPPKSPPQLDDVILAQAQLKAQQMRSANQASSSSAGLAAPLTGLLQSLRQHWRPVLVTFSVASVAVSLSLQQFGQTTNSSQPYATAVLEQANSAAMTLPQAAITELAIADTEPLFSPAEPLQEASLNNRAIGTSAIILAPQNDDLSLAQSSPQNSALSSVSSTDQNSDLELNSSQDNRSLDGTTAALTSINSRLRSSAASAPSPAPVPTLAPTLTPAQDESLSISAQDVSADSPAEDAFTRTKLTAESLTEELAEASVEEVIVTGSTIRPSPLEASLVQAAVVETDLIQTLNNSPSDRQRLLALLTRTLDSASMTDNSLATANQRTIASTAVQISDDPIATFALWQQQVADLSQRFRQLSDIEQVNRVSTYYLNSLENLSDLGFPSTLSEAIELLQLIEF
ncbi:MAG: hypothetical protein COC19_03750 [SAR86 cluster bacterium]|uniref:Uncharacterized protein n=1 Tax=SAR86 cluster bacterium TaxID=2030880 RepID=A0A2A4MQB0_9GAMM|nr:MAG: hypothetical protein COC19_03750 [SAR86 cluster bacterium]